MLFCYKWDSREPTRKWKSLNGQGLTCVARVKSHVGGSLFCCKVECKRLSGDPPKEWQLAHLGCITMWVVGWLFRHSGLVPYRWDDSVWPAKQALFLSPLGLLFRTLVHGPMMIAELTFMLCMFPRSQAWILWIPYVSAYPSCTFPRYQCLLFLVKVGKLMTRTQVVKLKKIWLKASQLGT